MAESQEISLKVVRPRPGENLTIREGSTFVIGTVSPPQSKLTVNGVAADVSSDGAFIAFAPIQALSKPQSIKLGRARKQVDAAFDCAAQFGDKKMRRQILVALPSLQKATEPTLETFEKAVLFRVVEEQILSQTATTNWGLLHLPQNAFVLATARKGSKLLLRAGSGQGTWVEEAGLRRVRSAPSVTNIAINTISPRETRFVVGDVVPFSIEQTLSPVGLVVTFYCPDSVRFFTVPCPTAQPWGFSASYATNTLIVTQRFAADMANGLRGKTICLDPGHNPDPGAIGPRGLEEREANLKIGYALEKMLAAAGAKVVFTHRQEPLPLKERRKAAIQFNPDIFVSLHNNSVPDGTDPRTNYGTSTFYYHPQSKPLADAVQASMLRHLGFPDQKVNQKSLSVCRVSEFPAILVEPTYIILPEHEKMLMDEAGQQKIARAIFEGIDTFFKPSKQ